jgi:regulatory protein
MAKPFGIHRIRYELKLKGINETTINDELAAAFHNYSEHDSIRPLIQKQMKKYAGIDALKKKQRLYHFLNRRGFSQNIINKTIKDL